MKGWLNMVVLIDTNIVLDILLRREPYYVNAARIGVLSEYGCIIGTISASSVTDIYYVISKEFRDKTKTISVLKDILCVVQIAPVTEYSIYEALDLNWDDFEDSVQYVTGKNAAVEYIITRNPKDFNNNEIKVVSPDDFLKIYISRRT